MSPVQRERGGGRASAALLNKIVLEHCLRLQLDTRTSQTTSGKIRDLQVATCRSGRPRHRHRRSVSVGSRRWTHLGGWRRALVCGLADIGPLRRQQRLPHRPSSSLRRGSRNQIRKLARV